MILEGAFELRKAKEYQRLKKKEQDCYEEWRKALEEWKKAIEGCENAWKNGDGQDMETARQKADKKEEVWDTAKAELQAETQEFMSLVLLALKQGRYTEKDVSVLLCCQEGERNGVHRESDGGVQPPWGAGGWTGV